MKKQNKNLKKALAVLIAALGLGTAWADWRFVDGKLTNDNPRCSFPAQVVTLTDGAGNNITGLQLTGKNEESTKKIDFTDVEKDTEHKVISASAEALARNCREFIAPDMFDLSERMFKDATTKGVYVTNIVISPNVVRFPKQWAQQTPLKTLKPEKFPYVKSFEDKCFSSCTNFQVDVGNLIDPGVTNIGKEAFYNVPVKGELMVESLEFIGGGAFHVAEPDSRRKTKSYLKRIVLHGKVETIPAQCFYNAGELELADLSGCTMLRMIGDSAFGNCSNLVSDVSLLINSVVTNIGTTAFCNAPLSGSLVLTNIQRIGAMAFCLAKEPARKKAGLATVELSGNLANLSFNCFAFQTKLGVFTFGVKDVGSKTIGQNPFEGCSSLGEIWFKGFCPERSVVERILADVPVGPDCRVYASRTLQRSGESKPIWPELAVPATAEELAKLSEADRRNCFGIFQTANGKRKAFFVHRRSPFEGKDGVLIVVR